MINYLKSKDEWKIQLSVTINLTSFKVTNETRAMHTKNDKIEIMIGNESIEII